MGQEQKNEQKNPQVAPAKMAPVAAPAAQPPGRDALNLQLSDAQLQTLLKGLVYGSIAMGIVNNMPGITATAKNLQRIKDLGDAVLELVNQ